MALLILRLHPAEPVTGNAFDEYLDGLSITAFDLATDNADGVQVGTAQYVAPPDPQEPWEPHGDSGIVQHFDPRQPVPQPPPSPPRMPAAQSVATAVIELALPQAHPEHLTTDLRLEITRGAGTIVHRQVYFNVPVSGGGPPSPDSFPDLQPTSLFLALPEPGREVDPGDAFVELPADGTPPRFDDLLSAVNVVLGHDPGGPSTLASLTSRQACHVAYEIVWNQKFRPLPRPERASLEEIYTLPDADDDDSVQARTQFEAELRAYYSTGDNDAERLAAFVSALAAAAHAESLSASAVRVGFRFPVRLGATNAGARLKSVRVILSGPNAPLETSFGVPAAYFYALGATTPAPIAAEQRYRLATLAEEDQTRAQVSAAVERGIVVAAPNGTIAGIDVPAINTAQAARRLRALGAVNGVAPQFELNGPDADQVVVQALVAGWLDFSADDVQAFWVPTLPAQHLAGHLELVLRALTDGHQSLIDVIKTASAAWPPVVTASDVDARTTEQWRGLFGDPINEGLLPAFTLPGSPAERVAAFIRHVRKFVDVDLDLDAPDDPELSAPPRFRPLTEDLLTRFVAQYGTAVGTDFVFGGAWTEADVLAAISVVLPDDAPAQRWLEQAIRAIDELTRLAQAPGIPPELAFSVMEALYARGFTSRGQVAALTQEQLHAALTGTAAHRYAAAIVQHAGGPAPVAPSGDDTPRSVNPDDCLVNCVPPVYLSPLGPVAYLQELLLLTHDQTCADTPADSDSPTLGQLLSDRRGPLGELLATRSNLETPVPLIDLVNECLEGVAADPTTPAGVVHQTNSVVLGGHSIGEHDAEALFCALPEHSTPESDAYDQLRADFSAPGLPYCQPVDVTRTYLAHLGTSRFATMRRFRRDITELVLDPAQEPADFQRHSWRYPVRIDIAREYLGITHEEHDLLFTTQITGVPSGGRPALRELYGFPANTVDGVDWKLIVVRLPEFLRRTGLTYCDFLDLWRSRFVEFSSATDDHPTFPNCEPCHLDDYRIVFLNPDEPVSALRKLAVFIRLWHTLRKMPGRGYGFAELRDICVVLELFDGSGTINPDFVRQLAAFQLLRDRFRPELSDPDDPPAPTATDANRTHLLSLWTAPPTAKYAWAVDELLDRVQYYAKDQLYCDCRPPEFRKLLEENLRPLSRLAGFDPDVPGDSWSAHPTHTLRFVEVLAKIYASDFGVGEILYLFTTEPHLRDDDPFPLQPVNETHDSPLGLPDDELPFALADLRTKLLAVDVTAEDAESWTWDRVDAALRQTFGFAPPAGTPDSLLVLGQHFFPSVLEASGYPVTSGQSQYRAGLAGTSALMWNTPPGPLRYDRSSEELFVELPLTDESVIAKLSRIRQLQQAEQDAVRELYYAPRADLAPFAFLFTDIEEAEAALIQEPDEQRRWAYFQHAFAVAHRRAEVIGEHLAAHVAKVTGRQSAEGTDVASTVLRALYADENAASGNWEDDSGEAPPVTWPNQPSGSAFAALLGVMGTGLLGELTPTGSSTAAWREIRGPMDAFGAARNAANVPVPTVLPDLGLTVTPGQQDFVNVSNGFFSATGNGETLGGGQGFTVVWTGALLIDDGGTYEFRAGGPTADDHEPDVDAASDKSWRVLLKRGQRSWVLLSHDWPDETAPPGCAEVTLRRGVYDLVVEISHPRPEYGRQEHICPLKAGFQLKYSGPDSGGSLMAIPHDRLFRTAKNATLAVDGITGSAQRYLRDHYTASLRDIRRTYQRAFKAVLFAHRFELSAQPVADDGQSEIGYLLAHGDDFAGVSYPRGAGGFTVHRANFDLNLLPLLDEYLPPTIADDQRVAPSVRRQQALFDWWERIFDYTLVRRDTARAPEPPLWLLFHENAEQHPDVAAHLRRHLGVEPRHAPLVLRQLPGYDVTGADLEDERWTVRLWHADRWLRSVRAAFLDKGIRPARPDLWASDNPGEIPAGETESGNDNLTAFVRDGCIENGPPRRYEDIKVLNDGLRVRGRAALLAHLCGMNRVVLPAGGVVSEPKELSELVLLDVEAGLGQRATRVEEAISAVQTFVQRARLGLEPAFPVSRAFASMWDERFATFRVWEACTRRRLYRENWIDWDELELARRSEAFTFLEDELRRRTLTVPVAGGLEYWPGERPPQHPGLQLLQAREPAQIRRIDPDAHGFEVLGTPERHARPSWLAALGLPQDEVVILRDTNDVDPQTDSDRLPMWIRAAIRLGVNFVRVAAAGEPPACTDFAPRPAAGDAGCCAACGQPHAPLVDEYYFWLIDSYAYEPGQQVADDGNGTVPDGGVILFLDGQTPTWSWHDPTVLPKLLRWEAEPEVHLAWCRVHNGEFTQPRRSFEGVRVSESGAELVLLGRDDDSLRFEVVGGEVPVGHSDPAAPGFRYDMATDTAVTLPLVVAPTDPATEYPGHLDAYPYFAYFDPGAEVVPPSVFGPAVAVASSLRAHCRFEAALKWYELAFDPLRSDAGWLQCQDDDTVERVEDDGTCCHDSTLASDTHYRERSIVLHYLDTLLDWGDALLRRNTPESTQQARLIYDTAAKLLGRTPRTVIATDPSEDPDTVAGFVAHHAPLNPRLMALYERSADRLTQVRSRLNAARLESGRSIYWDANSLRDGWLPVTDPCLDEGDWCAAPSPYRFAFLIQKAQELANEVGRLGAALLSAYEKGDSEYLGSLRETHERQLLNLVLEVRQNQWRDADWQLQALQKTKEIAQAHHRYYTLLIQNGLNNREDEYEDLISDSTTLRAAANVTEGLAQTINTLPDFFAGFPASLTWVLGGTKQNGVLTAIARVANGLAEIASSNAGLRLSQAGFERREEEWRHQVEILDIDLQQIERQILAGERRRDVALRELNNHQRQVEHSAEVHDFLRDKFTSHALYLFLQQDTAALHSQMYELALHTAHQAQRAFNYERGHTASRFVKPEVWDHLREGLQAGDRLQLALRQMEHAYLAANTRDYELTKHFSLRLHFPLEFLRLASTGVCEVDIPEWMFDLDYPGHFLRRIKNVTLTIPAVVGPYTGVQCRLTLLSSTTRVNPHLADPPHSCCPDGRPGNGYLALPDDPRMVNQYAAAEAIATSSGQNDAGMFELNFRDERYLPFEFAGAVSRWRIELPSENNQFDIDTVADVMLNLHYTAREGGEILRRAATEITQRRLPGAGVRFFDVQRDMGDAWHRFHSRQDGSGDRPLPLRLSRGMFPFLTGQREIRINRIELLFEAAGAVPSAHQLVEFVDTRGEPDCGGIREIRCVASAEWPGLYHGVVDVDLGPLGGGIERELALFRFAGCPSDVTRAFVFCHYQAHQAHQADEVAGGHRSPSITPGYLGGEFGLGDRGGYQPVHGVRP
ncbi:MAG: neuraminidase-like domain-containing protein [Mycobacterium sp.]